MLPWTPLLPAMAVVLVVAGDLACHYERMGYLQLRRLRAGCAAVWVAYYTMIGVVYAVHGSIMAATIASSIAAVATWLLTRARRALQPIAR